MRRRSNGWPAPVRYPARDVNSGHWQLIDNVVEVASCELLETGANVVSTFEAVKRKLPQLRASLPPGIKVEIASDRTTTIVESIADVRFTLLLTIALVVGVIAVFRRKLWATAIPAISVPISPSDLKARQTQLLNSWGIKLFDKLKTLPELSGVATDQQSPAGRSRCMVCDTKGVT